MKRILWESRSSWFLYFYLYVFFIVAAIGLSFIGPVYSLIPLAAALLFVANAKSMKYELTDVDVYFSGCLFDQESDHVPLKDIKAFYVINNPPWSHFSLGTVLLITDLTAEAHPCIKCIKNPELVVKKMRRKAIKQGAQLAGF